MACPPSSTCSDDEPAERALLTTLLTAAFGSSFARWSKVTVANPIRLSRESVFAAYGLTTPATWGSLATRATVALTVFRVVGSVRLPVRARNTIWSESPACAGNRCCSRSTARCESVPGSVKLPDTREPTEEEMAKTPIAPAIHAITTKRRWDIVQRASLSIIFDQSFMGGKVARCATYNGSARASQH